MSLWNCARKLEATLSIAPQVGAAVKWYALPAELIVTARSDGSMTWRGLSATGNPAAVKILSAALDSVRHRGEGVMIWPDGFAADSIIVRLSLLSGSFDSDGPKLPHRSKARHFLAFTIMHPAMSPALPKVMPDVRYPLYSERHGVTGYLVTQFVVDTNGRAVMSTFRDLWPSNLPRLDDDKQEYYDTFLAAVRDGVAKETFTPARVGSCMVPQRVQFPVAFVQPARHHAAP